MTKEAKKRDLENRLIEFAVRVIHVVGVLPSTKTGNHIGAQMIRSGTSPAANYGEAQDAESRSDFVHKVKIVLIRILHDYSCNISPKGFDAPHFTGLAQYSPPCASKG